MCFVSVARAVISDVTVTPQDDRSLLVQWRSPVSTNLTGFVVEWRPLLKADLSLTQFEITDRNQTRLVITGMFFCIAGFKIHVCLILLTFYSVFLIWCLSFTTRIHSYARSSFSCAQPACMHC